MKGEVSKCDCLNECGDDPWLRTGKAEPCDGRKRGLADLAQFDKDLLLLNDLARKVRDKKVAAALERVLRRIGAWA
jgi:hypothetical protein